MLITVVEGVYYLHPLCILLALAFGAWIPSVARIILAACRAVSALGRF